MPMRKKASSRHRITLDLADGLLSALDATASAVKESRSGFILAAIEVRLRSVKRAQVDAAFEEMGADSAYQAELHEVEKEMSPASDAAWRRIDAMESAPAPTARSPRSKGRTRATR